ncbi:unnamed protein product [Choristocarpus tenellus]
MSMKYDSCHPNPNPNPLQLNPCTHGVNNNFFRGGLLNFNWYCICIASLCFLSCSTFFCHPLHTRNIINIDFSEPLIEIMKHIHSDKPGLEWKVMNVRDMDELETGSFDAIVDKGLTDSLMYSDDFKYHVAQLSLGCARLLKPGGVYLLADYRDIGRLEGLFKRAEWEGGSIRENGKVTTRINLFKGTRTDDSLRILVEEQLEGLLEDVGDTDNNVEDEDGGDLSWIMDTGLQGLLGKGFMGGGSLEEGEGEGGKW